VGWGGGGARRSVVTLNFHQDDTSD
jgi:hypothetical protein